MCLRAASQKNMSPAHFGEKQMFSPKIMKKKMRCGLSLVLTKMFDYSIILSFRCADARHRMKTKKRKNTKFLIYRQLNNHII